MSQHRSLRAASTSGAKRNVMKRFERVEILKRRGQCSRGRWHGYWQVSARALHQGI
ncbi:MAG: small basic protein [Candidatus Acidiferrales bacterium]